MVTTTKGTMAFEDIKADWATALFSAPGEPPPGDTMMPIPVPPPCGDFGFPGHVLDNHSSILVVYQRWDSLVAADLADISSYFRAMVATIEVRARATQDVLAALISMG